jgi:hypothetical protein
MIKEDDKKINLGEQERSHMGQGKVLSFQKSDTYKLGIQGYDKS